MDAELRAALRSDDWSERAGAYRRAGEPDRARREVARAAREGLEGAREALEEYPLDADARALLEVLEAPPDATQRAAWAAQILWGDGDPRLAERAEAWLNRAVQRGLHDEGSLHLLITDYVERLGHFLGAGGPALERTLLNGREGIRLMERAHLSPLQLLQLRFLSEASGDGAFQARVRALLEGHSSEAQIESVVGVEGSRAGGVEFSGGPWRPSWVRPLLRDEPTLALSPHALRGKSLGPGSLELPECEWVLLFAVDVEGPEVFAPAPLGLLLSAVSAVRKRLGDRIVRFLSSNRFLVPLENEALAERCHQVVRESPTGISGSLVRKERLDRADAWPLVLGEGLAAARSRAPRTLEVEG